MSWKQVLPSRETLERVVNGNEWSVPCAGAGDVANGVVCLQVASYGGNQPTSLRSEEGSEEGRTEGARTKR